MSRFLLALVAVLAVIAVALHLPPVQTGIGARALLALRARGIDARVARVSFNIFTLRVHAESLTLSRVDTPGEPFVTAASVDLSVPSSALRGRFAIDEARIERLRVMLLRRADGSVNWPSSSGSGGSARLTVGALAAPDFAVTWRDLGAGASLAVPHATIQLKRDPRGASGRLVLDTPATFTRGPHQTDVYGDARLTWDGARLLVEAARLEAPEGTLAAAGSLGVLSANPDVALDVNARLNLRVLAAWADLEPRPWGDLAVSGRLSGPFDGARVETTVTGKDLAWRDINGAALEGKLSADRAGVDVSALSLRVAGGAIDARGHVALGDRRAASRLAMTWRALDLASLLKAAGTVAPLAASTNGRADLAWDAWQADALTGEAQAVVAPRPGGRAAIRVGGRAALFVSRGAWRATFDQSLDEAVRVNGAVGGRIVQTALGSSTLSGEATIAAEPLDAVRTLLVNAAVIAPDGLTSLTGGRAHATVLFSGSIGDPRADVELAVAHLMQPGLGPVDLDARVAITRRTATLDDLAARFKGNTLHGRGALSLGSPAAGRLEVTGEHLAIAGQRADRLDAALSLAGTRIQLERLALGQGEGRLDLTGSYDTKTHAMAASARGVRVAISPLVGADGHITAPISARADFDLTATGTTDDPQGSGRVALTATRWNDIEIGEVTSALTMGGRRVQADASLPALFATVTAAIGLNPFGAFTADARISDGDIASLAERLGIPVRAPVAGTASLAAHAEGDVDHLDRTRGALTLRRIDGRVGDVPVRMAGAGTATYDGETLDAGELRLEVGRAVLHVTGGLGRSPGGSLVASFDGPLADAAAVALNFAPAAGGGRPPQADGTLAVSLRVAGTLDRPDVSGDARLDEGTLSAGGLPPVTGLTLRAAYAGGLLDLTRLDGSWLGASVSASGRAPITLLGGRVPAAILRSVPATLPAARLTARIDTVTPSVLAPWLPPETIAQLGGTLSGSVSVDTDALSLSAARGELRLDRAALTVSGVPLDQQRPTRVSLAGGRLRIEDWTWGAAGNRITLTGGLALEGTRAIDVGVDGDIDVRALSAFLPGVGTGGRAVLTGRVTGGVNAPQLAGRVDLRDGELRLAAAGFAASELNGRIDFDRDTLSIPDIYGTANGGTIDLAGRLRLDGFQPVGGRFALTGRGLAMAVPTDLRTEVDADLSLTLDRGGLAVGGEVRVLRGAYRRPISLAGGLLQALQQTAVSIQTEPTTLVDRTRLDVRVTTTDDVVVDNNYAQLAMGADLRVVGTIAQPVLLGRAAAREGGRLYLGGHTYRVVGSGAIDFANPSRIEPDLDISVSTRVGGYDVTLGLKGTPSALETPLTSDPPLGQADIVSLLATGSKRTSGTMPVIGSEQVLTYVSGEVLGVAGRAVGLDTLRLEQGSGDVSFDAGLIATEGNPASRLTFGKQVTRQVEVIFSQNLKDTGAFTWIVGYRPRGNVELRVVSDENNDRIYDFRHDVSFGGGDVGATVKPPLAARVGTVRFVALSGFSEKDLRGRVSMTEGDRFDFYRWQSDRERLERVCRDAGRLEGRVSARRSDRTPGPPVVDLEYDLRCGPRTIVRIDGAPDPRALRTSIEAAWSRSIFDAFLVDEAKNIARETLVQDGYLRSTIGVSIDTRGDDEKALVVSVVRGPQSRDARVVFAGNTHISTDRLDQLVRERALDRTAWVDAAPLVRAVTGVYRDEGFAAVRVIALAPQFDGPRATLPVTIDEGAAFTVAAVEFSGTLTEPVDDLRKAAALEHGMVLTRAAADRAVRQLTDHYRSRGYSNARLALATRSDAAARGVTVTVTVDPGPRQVLSEVVVEGARRTSDAFVARELHLDLGQPVDSTAWSRARRRLYDTGAFRQVDLSVVPIDTAAAGARAAEQPVRARVIVDEWPWLNVRYGFELADMQATDGRTLRPGMAGDIKARGLFGGAVTTGVALRLTTDFRAARAFATTHSFFGLPLTSNLFASRSREQIGASERPFVTDKTDFTAEQRFRAGSRLQLSYGYSFQRNHTFDLHADPDDPFAFDITVNVARLTTTGLMDSRDDLVDATRGRFFSSTFEFGTSGLGSDLRFAKYFVQQSWYRRIAGLVFATAGRLGLAAGYGQELIPSERFFAGGGNSVRGYRENSLGPRDFFGDVVGGNAMLVLNEELRFPIAGRVRGVAFVDAGNVFARAGDFSLGGLRGGAGVGVRVQTPFALLRVDFASPLRPRPGEPRTRWFFSIGQVF